jgi:hypothetical protein
MRRSLGAIAALAIGVSAFVGFAAPAQAKPNGTPPGLAKKNAMTSAPAQSQSGNLQVNAGESIQAAIDAASPGATINVGPGTYAESLVIAKDGINLVGNGATLIPPSVPSPVGAGILVADADLSSPDFPPPINHIVTGVSINGFTIDGQGQQDQGVFVFGAANTTLTNDVARNNTGYGYFANTSTGTVFANDVASDGAEAGFYVGDSPNANASLTNVEAFNNGFGIFIRSAEGVRLMHVNSHDNCLGMLVLADNPGPAGNVDVHASAFDHNNNACEADEEEDTPALSGIGIALSGANDVRLNGNSISGNVPGGETFATAGIAIIVGDAGTPPTNISIHGNHMAGNATKFLNDGSGVNVKVSGNH